MTTPTRVLIVDDDLSASRLLKMNLERAGGYIVRDENKGTRALAAAREFQPDIILLDVNMPDMEGGEVAARIRADGRLSKTPIIFLTSIVSPREAGETGLVSGGYQFLAKPVNSQKLMAHIQSILTGTGAA